MSRIALIAHDEKKPELVAFVNEHIETFQHCEVVATATTGEHLDAETDLTVERVASGPWGGDLLVGAEVAKNALDGVIFLRDPLHAHPHEPDISALFRICDVRATPLATNLASATALVEKLDREFHRMKRAVPDERETERVGRDGQQPRTGHRSLRTEHN